MDYQITYDEEKGVTTCIIKNCKYDAIYKFFDVGNHVANGLKEGILNMNHINEEWLLPDKIVGIAIKDPDDKYDKHIGDDSAFNDAYFRYISRLTTAEFRIARDIKNLMDFCIGKAEARYIKGSVARMKERGRIDEMICKNCNLDSEYAPDYNKFSDEALARLANANILRFRNKYQS